MAKKKLLPLDALRQVGLGLGLAAARLEKTEQVVLKARAICARDLLPDQ